MVDYRSIADWTLLASEPLFPFGLPGATLFYLSLYVLTWVLHVVFMNYVLAGSAYLAASTLLTRRTAGTNPLAETLRDWMPFMLSAAITAGIAPLLFAQILYPQHFYTANLLLFHRWMAILPVLIVGFYLLYLLKSKLAESWPLTLRGLVGGGALACFVFIAWSWTENHLLSLGEGAWVRQYASGSALFRSPQLVSRLVLWFTAAFPIMAVVLGWQLRYQHGCNSGGASQSAVLATSPVPGTRRTSAMALAGIILTGVCAALYALQLDQDVRGRLTDASGIVYAAALGASLAVQAGGWTYQFRCGRLTRPALIVISAAAAVNLLSVAVLRELIRHAAIDLAAVYELHAQAANIGGFGVFALFLLLNALLIGFCIRLVKAPKNEPGTNGGR